MSEVTKEIVLETLGHVRDERRGDDIVALGMVTDVVVDGGEVKLAIEFDDRPTPERHDLEDAIADAVETLEGVTDCYVDAQVANPPPPAEGRVSTSPDSTGTPENSAPR